MSGGRYPYPKHVWSPTGGWWPNPRNGFSNFLKVSSGMILLTLLGYQYGASKQIDPAKKYSDETMAKWNQAAARSMK